MKVAIVGGTRNSKFLEYLKSRDIISDEIIVLSEDINLKELIKQEKEKETIDNINKSVQVIVVNNIEDIGDVNLKLQKDMLKEKDLFLREVENIENFKCTHDYRDKFTSNGKFDRKIRGINKKMMNKR